MSLAIATLPNGSDVVVQIGADGSVWGKVRAGAQPWTACTNAKIGSAIPGSTPVARAAGAQFQCFYEVDPGDRVFVSVTDGVVGLDGSVAWNEAELP